MAASEHEIERMLVRIVGDPSGYSKALDQAIIDTQTKVAKMQRIASEQKVFAQLQAQGAALTAMMATPLEKYNQELSRIHGLYAQGAISAETYNRATSRITKAIEELNPKAETFAQRMDRIGASVAGVGAKITMVGGILTASLTAPLTALGYQAFNAAVKMDSLERGLVSVAGSTEAAEKQMISLREIAKLPGLGFAEAVQGSTRLQAAGFSARLAERALMGFGNALATVGKGRVELDGVILALTQIISKGKISAEEINQIAERVPQIRKIMQQAFGTADTEKLQKMGITPEQFIEAITTELEKLAKVTGGAQNQMENFSDASFIALSKVGKVILEVVGPAMDSLGKIIGDAAVWFENLGHGNQQLVVWSLAVVAAIGPLTAGIGGTVMIIGNLIASYNTTVTAVQAVIAATQALSTAQSVAALKAVGLRIGYAALAGVVVYLTYEIIRAVTEGEKWDKWLADGRQNLAKHTQALEEANRKQREFADSITSAPARKSYLEGEVERLTAQMMILRKQATMELPTGWSGWAGKLFDPELFNTMTLNVETAKAEFEATRSQLEYLNQELAETNKQVEIGSKVAPKIVADAQKFIEKLREETEAYNMSANAAKIHHYEVLGVDAATIQEMRTLEKIIDTRKADTQAREDAEKATQNLSDRIMKFTEGLREQIATFGMASDAAQLYRLEQEAMRIGISDAARAELDGAAALIRKKMSMEEEKRLMEQGKRLIEQTLTPREKYLQQQEELNQLMKVGAITPKAYEIAMKGLRTELEQIQKQSTVNIRVNWEGNDAVRKGSEEFRRMLAAVQERAEMRLPANPQKQWTGEATFGALTGQDAYTSVSRERAGNMAAGIGYEWKTGSRAGLPFEVLNRIEAHLKDLVDLGVEDVEKPKVEISPANLRG